MRACLSVLVLVMTMAPARAASLEQPDAQVQDLKRLSLEELLQIDVTTVSRERERRIDAPAAVSVITGEDIRRYGVDTLADALRLADSVSVARFNGGSWAIATRGFSAITNNKLLVMIDGRSVYTPLFGGVFWEAQHVILPDLDRIEIIRGPAGTLWGPNAVNGVINIITKRASDSQGALVRGVVGSRERAHVAARYGGEINRQTTYRLYGVGSEFDSPELQDGSSAKEDRRLRQAGGRVDWEFDGRAHYRTIKQVHGFAQTEIAVKPDFTLTLGTRGERTTFSGFELQPAARAKYTPRTDALVWGAISRAVRMPTRFDQELRVQVNNLVVIRGDRDFKPEHLTAYGTGARFNTGANVSVEASVFYNDYDDLRSQEATPLITLANLYDGHTTGVELAGTVQPHARWMMHGSYTGQRVSLKPRPESRDTMNARAEADDPSHMLSLRSYLNLPGDFELDGFFRAVSQLRASKLPAYRELDMRVGWEAKDRWDCHSSVATCSTAFTPNLQAPALTFGSFNASSRFV